MSSSLGVDILLPLDDYSPDAIYDTDDRIQKADNHKEDGKYYKKLKIRSVYTSKNDIKEYFAEKYGLSEEEFRNYSLSYRYRDWHYRFGNGREIVMGEEEYESLAREHVDEDVYCLIYSHFSPDIYSFVLNKLFDKGEAVINDDLINKAIELIGKEYDYGEGDQEEEEDKRPLDRVLEDIIDYEGSMDGKLLVSLIIGREVANRVGGMAVAYYE